MTTDRTPVLTGGCQCGAVRFAVFTDKPVKTSVCHCRMCQKAVGGPFISLAMYRHGDFAWTKSQPATYRSSSIANRDFCAACGTPLTYCAIGGEFVEVTTGSFDRPDQVVPKLQFGTESRLDWVGSVVDLPGRTTDENFGPEKMGRIVSHQHGDQE